MQKGSSSAFLLGSGYPLACTELKIVVGNLRAGANIGIVGSGYAYAEREIEREREREKESGYKETETQTQ